MAAVVRDEIGPSFLRPSLPSLYLLKLVGDPVLQQSKQSMHLTWVFGTTFSWSFRLANCLSNVAHVPHAKSSKTIC